MLVKLALGANFQFVSNVYIICVNSICMCISHSIKEKKPSFVRTVSDRMVHKELWVELELSYCIVYSLLINWTVTIVKSTGCVCMHHVENTHNKIAKCSPW